MPQFIPLHGIKPSLDDMHTKLQKHLNWYAHERFQYTLLYNIYYLIPCHNPKRTTAKLRIFSSVLISLFIFQFKVAYTIYRSDFSILDKIPFNKPEFYDKHSAQTHTSHTWS